MAEQRGLTEIEQRQLEAGAKDFGLTLTPAQVQLLDAYCAQLTRWNAAFNLVAESTMPHKVSVHLLDSLAVHSYVRGGRILDVGTGAGFPGIPLAIIFPHTQFVLLDSNGKKTRFLRQVCNVLTLDNVEVVQGRLESYKDKAVFDQIVTRAFSAVEKLLNLLASAGIQYQELLLLKGKFPEDELAGISAVGYDVTPLHVPGVDAERHLVRIKTDV